MASIKVTNITCRNKNRKAEIASIKGKKNLKKIVEVIMTGDLSKMPNFC